MATTIDPIGQALSRRVSRRSVLRGVRDIARDLKAAHDRYRGGLPAERSAYGVIRSRLRHEMRATHFEGVGRRIDLMALLHQQRKQGDMDVPVWALVDPRAEIGPGNDCRVMLYPGSTGVAWLRTEAGRYAMGLSVGGVMVPLQFECESRTAVMRRYGWVAVSGIPALPPQARRILRNPRMKYANMVGLLFQPEEWMLPKPDPAIVVEWADRPGEYYCLAVWGADRPRIMEFVD